MEDYYRYTGKARLQKSIKVLQGIVEGISIDRIINRKEIDFLNDWILENSEFNTRHPFNEVIPLLKESINDKILTKEEKKDILWLCNKLSIDDNYYDSVTQDMQRLHGILTGILADGKITREEINELKKWIFKHNHLKSLWPYDELESILISISKDGIIEDDEIKALQNFLYEFSSVDDDSSITDPIFIDEQYLISGVCSIDPDIEIESRVFCFTGKTYGKTREELSAEVLERGGIVKKGVSKKVDYLVIGSEGNPCWAYSCYGRKVEKAVKLRKQGVSLSIIHEIDFLDSIIE